MFSRKPGKAVYEQAERQFLFALSFFVQLVICFAVFLGVVITGLLPQTLQTATGPITNPVFTDAATVLGILLAAGAAYGGLVSLRIGLFQIQQAEERVSTDVALGKTMREMTNAMGELTKELRRRPEVSSSVTLALFAVGDGNKAAKKAP